MKVICNNENNSKEVMEKREIVFDIIPETKFEKKILMESIIKNDNSIREHECC